MSNLNIHTFGERIQIKSPGSTVILPKGVKGGEDWLRYGQHRLSLTNVMVGLEIELENARNIWLASRTEAWEKDLVGRLFNITEDNSLRNSGVELVSVPLTQHYLPLALHELEKALQEFPEVEATGRCGVHIHINCLEMRTSKLFLFLLCLLLVEEQLYMATGNRYSNIFCVPHQLSNYRDIHAFCNPQNLLQLTGDISAESVERLRNNLQRNCHKYSGINLVPLADKGTIELRMFSGTTKLKIYEDVLYFIAKLQAGINDTRDVKQHLKTFLTLNTTSEYNAFIQQFSGPSVNVLALDTLQQTCNNIVPSLKRFASTLIKEL